MKKAYEFLKGKIGYIAGTVGLITLLGFSSFVSYNDMPGGFISSSDARLKNGAAAVVSGLVSQELYGGNNSIDLKVNKFLWAPAYVKGETTPDSVDVVTDTWYASSRFKGKRDKEGNLEGTVAKSKYNWSVSSDGDDYNIGRIGWQWNVAVKDLKVANGEISGTFTRPVAKLNLNIEGTYSKDGHVEIDIDNWLVYGITMEGDIKKDLVQ